VAQDDVFSGNQDTQLTGNLLANNGNGPDTDPDNDPLSVTPATFTTSHGQVVIFANGDFTYTPSAGYFGPEMFFYTVLDGQGHSDTGRVDITINQVLPNDPPVAQDDAFTGNQDANILGNLLVNNGSGPDTDPERRSPVGYAGDVCDGQWLGYHSGQRRFHLYAERGLLRYGYVRLYLAGWAGRR
jgi:hypothetical protein